MNGQKDVQVLLIAYQEGTLFLSYTLKADDIQIDVAYSCSLE